MSNFGRSFCSNRQMWNEIPGNDYLCIFECGSSGGDYSFELGLTEEAIWACKKF